ncbi:MAG: DUF1275 domain-containing protein [Bacteriovoracaceae bacterium]|nr:DUF1275 domain-containing protein [Bacteriovoracaceae bacterium]
MFKYKLYEDVNISTYLKWLILSFSAGSINAGGYLCCYHFVSHITGFYTVAGIALKHDSFLKFLSILTIPIFFLLGVMISALLTEKKKKDKDKLKYPLILCLVGILLTTVAFAGFFNFFGHFGETLNLRHDYLLLALLCMACGLQNAAITSSSGSTIRTTHLTGITTDLGIGIIRSEIHPESLQQQKIERKVNLFRFFSIIAFTLGSVVGAFFFVQFEYLGFLMPAFISFYFAWANS